MVWTDIRARGQTQNKGKELDSRVQSKRVKIFKSSREHLVLAAALF